MGYGYPKDPRKPWEWCPLCNAWYEIDRDEYSRAPMTVIAGCVHGPEERRLSEDDVRCASRSAEKITAAFRIGQIGAHP